jgi:hypothetical protein
MERIVAEEDVVVLFLKEVLNYGMLLSFLRYKILSGNEENYCSLSALASSTIIDHAEPDRSKPLFATKGVEEIHISAPLLPIAQLELEAHGLLTGTAPHESLVGRLGWRTGREDGRADELILLRRPVPRVVVHERVVVRVADGWVLEEPDVRLGSRAARDRARVVLRRELGDVDLEHAACRAWWDEGE